MILLKTAPPMQHAAHRRNKNITNTPSCTAIPFSVKALFPVQFLFRFFFFTKRSLLVFLSIVVFSTTASYAQLGNNYKYKLQYSEGINDLQTQQYARVAVIAKQMIEAEPKLPEGYLLMGNVHFKEKLYSLAIKNYEKAYLYRSEFMFNSDLLMLYEQMAAGYIYVGNEGRHLEVLLEATSWSRGKKARELQKHIGRAFFSLALLQRQRKNWVASKVKFIEAAQHNFLAKSAYFILAHYYATTSAQQLTENNFIYYRKKTKTEDRMSSFLYYFKLYQQQPSTAEDVAFLSKESVQRMRREIENFRNAPENLSDKALEADPIFDRNEELSLPGELFPNTQSKSTPPN